MGCRRLWDEDQEVLEDLQIMVGICKTVIFNQAIENKRQLFIFMRFVHFCTFCGEEHSEEHHL